jgi:hypothetical protein
MPDAIAPKHGALPTPRSVLASTTPYVADGDCVHRPKPKRPAEQAHVDVPMEAA